MGTKDDATASLGSPLDKYAAAICAAVGEVLPVNVDTCVKRHAQSVAVAEEIGTAHVPVPVSQLGPTQLPGTTFPSSSRKPRPAGLLALGAGNSRIASESATMNDAVITVIAFLDRKVDFVKAIAMCFLRRGSQLTI